MQNNNVINLILEVVDNASDELRRAMRYLQDLEREARQAAGRGFAVLKSALVTLGQTAVRVAGVISASIGAAATKGIADFQVFDKKIREVFTLLPGASEDLRREIEEDVLSFSREFGKLPNEVLPALYQSLSAGVPQDNVFTFLEDANRVAVGGITTLETAVDGLSSVVNAYGQDVISTAEVSDILFTTVRLGKTTVDELASSLGQVTPIASAAGIEFSEIGATLATVTARGLTTSESVTGLKAVISTLLNPSETMRDNLAAIGVESGEALLKTEGLTGALKALEIASGGNTETLAQMLGSTEALNTVLALTSESGAESFRVALQEMRESSGATDAAFQEMQGSLAYQMDLIKGSLGALSVEVGAKLAPPFAGALGKINEYMPVISEVVLGVFDDINSGVAFLQSTVIPQFNAGWSGAESETSSTFASIGGIVRDLYETFSDAFRAIGELWTNNLFPILKTLAPAVDNILKAAVLIVSAFVEAVSGLLSFLGTLLSGDFTNAWQIFKDNVKSILSNLVGIVSEIVVGIVDIFRALPEGMKTNLENMFNTIKNVFDRNLARVQVLGYQLKDALNPFSEGSSVPADLLARANGSQIDFDALAPNFGGQGVNVAGLQFDGIEGIIAEYLRLRERELELTREITSQQEALSAAIESGEDAGFIEAMRGSLEGTQSLLDSVSNERIPAFEAAITEAGVNLVDLVATETELALKTVDTGVEQAQASIIASLSSTSSEVELYTSDWGTSFDSLTATIDNTAAAVSNLNTELASTSSATSESGITDLTPGLSDVTRALPGGQVESNPVINYGGDIPESIPEARFSSMSITGGSMSIEPLIPIDDSSEIYYRSLAPVFRAGEQLAEEMETSGEVILETARKFQEDFRAGEVLPEQMHTRERELEALQNDLDAQARADFRAGERLPEQMHTRERELEALQNDSDVQARANFRAGEQLPAQMNVNLDRLEELVRADRVEKFQAALEAPVNAISAGAMALANQLPVLGSTLQAFLSGGLWMGVITFFVELISRGDAFGKVIERVNEVLEPLIVVANQIVEAFMPMLDPLFDLLLALVPLVDIISKILNPAIKLFATNLNIIVPIITGVIDLFVGIYDALFGRFFGFVGSNGESSRLNVGSFDVGSTFVPQDQLAMIHRGEMIIPASFSEGVRRGDLSIGANKDSKETNDLLRQLISKISSSENRLNIHINEDWVGELSV